MPVEIKSLRDRIEQTAMPAEAKKVAEQELEPCNKRPPAAAEYAVSRRLLDWILTLPWERQPEDKLDLELAARIGVASTSASRRSRTG